MNKQRVQTKERALSISEGDPRRDEEVLSSCGPLKLPSKREEEHVKIESKMDGGDENVLRGADTRKGLPSEKIVKPKENLPAAP